MKVHLDTDIGGDIDDLAALALLLRWPGVEITGITTVADQGGRRAGYARAALAIAGRARIPAAAGAGVDDHDYRWRPGYPPDDAFWPRPVAPAPGPIDAAIELLHASITQGARVIGIGPCTNLAHFDRQQPGLLRAAGLTLVGGWVAPPRPARSGWGNELDYNLQMDVPSALHVLTHCDPTLVPLHVTVETALRHAQLPALAASGPLGALLARQAAAYDATGEFASDDRATRADLPADFINHLYDALGCAVALGWTGARTKTLPLRLAVEDSWLHERIADDGIPTRVVMDVDGAAFDRLWLHVVTTGTIASEEER